MEYDLWGFDIRRVERSRGRIEVREEKTPAA